MRSVSLSIILAVLFSICHSNSNSTESGITVCETCSPCWNLFGKTYNPCFPENDHFNLFNNEQSVCTDTLILLIIIFLSIVLFIPICLWILYLWVKRCRHMGGKYVVNGHLIA